MKTYKPFLYSLGLIISLILVFYFLGEVIMPFVLGLAAAFMVDPIIKFIQKLIPNRKLAVTTFLGLSLTIFTGVLFLFGAEIVHDVKRLNNAFEIFAEDHQAEIDETNQTVKSYIEKIYSSDQVQQGIQQAQAEPDSAENTAIDQIQTAFSAVTSFFNSGGQDESKDSGSSYGLNWITICFGGIIYFFYMIYSFEYFEKRVKKYFDADLKKNSFIKNFIDDFRRIFLNYFRKRTEVVLICFAIFLTAFLIIHLPGAFLIAFIAALLCYIPHFHYLALIPVSLSCWVLSVETGTGFFIFIIIISSVFILISVLEETVFTPKIMRNFNGLNPAIMIVSFAIWSHLFGAVFGTLVALPLTTVLLIYLDQLLLHTKKVLTQVEKSNDQSE